MSEQEEFIEKARSPFSEAFEMFRKNHAAMAGLFVLILIVVGGLIGPYVYVGDPFEMVWAPTTPPGEEGYLLGTDYLGRDMVSMLIHGARVSITIGLSAAIVDGVYRHHGWSAGRVLQGVGRRGADADHRVFPGASNAFVFHGNRRLCLVPPCR